MNSLVIVGDVLLDRDVDGGVRRLSPDAPVPSSRTARSTCGPVARGSPRSSPSAPGTRRCWSRRSGTTRPAMSCTGLLSDGGVEVIDVGLEGATPEKVRIRGAGRTLLRLDRSSRRDSPPGPATAVARGAVRMAPAVLVADYGYGVATDLLLRSELAGRAAASSLVWDPHPAGPAPVSGGLPGDAEPQRGDAAACREVPDGASRTTWSVPAARSPLGRQEGSPSPPAARGASWR